MARQIVIVGGGAAGTLTAIHLARASRHPTHVTVVEPRAKLGEGIAYGTADPSHLLNVPANGMSAYDDEPDHFVRWAQTSPDVFISRLRYAEYLRDELSKLVADGRRTTLQHLRARATRIDAARLHVITDENHVLPADSAILALGNAAPTIPDWVRDYTSTSVVIDPWVSGALDSITSGSRVLCVGTGLTFVDIALSLARRGARVTGVSRHGLLPEVHAHLGALPEVPAIFSTSRDVLRWIRSQSDWRAAFAAFRPVTQATWRNLSATEQSRFLRHARRYWDVHRHRMSTTVADELRRLRQSGAVEVHRGDARAFARTGEFDVVVLCTGPDDATLRDAPPLAALVADGVACAGPHGMGIATDADNAQLLNSHGQRVDGLYAIGTLRRGTLWESTAVPEIRAEARRLASHLSA